MLLTNQKFVHLVKSSGVENVGEGKKKQQMGCGTCRFFNKLTTFFF